MPIRVTSIQRGCVYDGAGVRTTVFLKGCYLSCPWCCNPETIHFDKDLYYKRDVEKCGKSAICKSCEIHGGIRIKEKCPFGVYEQTYKDYETLELFELIIKDKPLFIESGGGVTFSGGEPLMQADAIYPLLCQLKDNGINIAMETSLYAPSSNFQHLFDYVDSYLVDLKFQYGFISQDSRNKFLDDFEYNIKLLQDSDKETMYRMVFPHQAVNNANDIVSRLKKYHIGSIELLACHSLGKVKYERLNRNYSLYTAPSDDDINLLTEALENSKIKSHIIKI